MNDIVIAHPRTGEVIELSTATDAELASVRVEAEEFALRLKAADDAIQAEVLARMDRAAEWTRRVSVGDRTYKFSAPSPTAGSTVYDLDALDLTLSELVDSGAIDPDTAAKAMPREVTVTVRVPWGESVGSVVAWAENLARDVAEVKTSVKAHLPTLNKLLKVERAADAVRAAGTTAEQKPRRVKFEADS